MKKLFLKIIWQIKSKLIWKIFLALLLNLFLVAILGFSISRYFWKNSLILHVIDLEESLVDGVVEYWEEYYEDNQHWPAELKDIYVWRRLMIESFAQDDFNEIYFFLRPDFFSHVSILDKYRQKTLSSNKNLKLFSSKNRKSSDLSLFLGIDDDFMPNKNKRISNSRYLSIFLEDILARFDQNNPLQYKNLAIKSKGEVVGWIRFPKILKEKNNQSNLWWQFWLSRLSLIFLPIFITLLIAYFLSRLLLNPMQDINKGLKAVEKNNFKYRIKSSRQDELGRLAKNFNLMASQMAEFADSKRFWIATISHELRTPLAILGGELESIIDGIRPANQKNLLSLRQEINDLTQLVTLLQETASYEQIIPQFETVEINALIASRVKRYHTLFDKKNMQLIFQFNPDKIFVSVEPYLINRALDKLLENSVAYTTTGPVIVKSELISGFWQLSVADSAPGVKKSELGKLFEHFYQVGDQKSKGSGLGLTICKSIIEAHQGTVEAKISSTGGLLIIIKLKALDKVV